MQRRWTILVDSREKHPLLFPKHMTMLDPNRPVTLKRTVTVTLHPVTCALKTGDYLLQGYEDCTIVERKGSVREIAHNCLSPADRGRFLTAIGRLAEEARRPVLLLEGSPTVLARAAGTDRDSACAIDALQRVLHEREIELHVVPARTLDQRRACGEWIARLLINGALRYG